MGSNANEKVLLTGGSGFIAWHVLNSLLGHGFDVVITVRSKEKGDRIIECLKASSQSRVTYEIVQDVAKDGAFDNVFKSGHIFTYVIHTASPYNFKVDNPVNDFLNPAIKGTTGILTSIRTLAPTVKRVVITSSSAAILNPLCHEKIYNESHWAPFTWEDAIATPEFAYATSKKLAEKAAWDFEARSHFTLATINNTYTFGPIPLHLPSLSHINTSNQRILDLLLSGRRCLGPTKPTFTWVDVRDVALAHVRAMIVPEAEGQRFFVVAGYFSNKRLADIVGVEEGEEEEVDDFPGEGKVFGFENGRSRRVLGMRYRDLEESVRDTVESILEWRRRNELRSE